MVYAGILAGGKGTRMGAAERPKQFLRLEPGGRPILVHTLDAFVSCAGVDRIIVASPADWLEYTRVLVAENFAPEQADRIHVIEGGADRSGSIGAVCSFIEHEFGLAGDDVLVSHDAVRPFVTQRVIEENIRFACEAGCTDTVVPATDTIVVSEGGQRIDDIPPRSRYYQGQTPQSFFIREYQELFARLSAEQRRGLTDACGVYVAAGREVHLVMGEYDNIKITTPHDIHVATSLLADRGAA